MNKASLIAPLLALAAAGCSAGAQESEPAGAAPPGQRSFDVGAFRAVSLAGSQDVVVTVGGAPSVRAEGDAEMLERLDIRVEDGTLVIGTRRGSFRSSGRVTVYVGAPSLAAAAIGGSGDMRIDRVQGERFHASIGGSGDMHIGRMEVDQAAFSIAGSGAIRAAGRAGRMTASVAGSGDVDAGGLEARSAAISIVGSGDVRGRASESAEVSVMGSGDVTVSGPARCAVNRMGSGNVRCNV